MSVVDEVKVVLGEALQIEDRVDSMSAGTGLLGSVPEFDSMAVVTVIAALEERFDFEVADDEIDAASFETVGSLAAFVQQKLDNPPR
ncbi:MAG: phosphopantetheine-binding protein [Gammaproteobacteria bacterium]|nr:phosphopantetheine-binding protein [Gammaproteobacteria bacterium]